MRGLLRVWTSTLSLSVKDLYEGCHEWKRALPTCWLMDHATVVPNQRVLANGSCEGLVLTQYSLFDKTFFLSLYVACSGIQCIAVCSERQCTVCDSVDDRCFHVGHIRSVDVDDKTWYRYWALILMMFC